MLHKGYVYGEIVLAAAQFHVLPRDVLLRDAVMATAPAWVRLARRGLTTSWSGPTCS